MPRFFSLDYLERVTLRDGTPVLLRLIAPDDKAALRRGFEQWSAESRYARFLAPKQQLSDDELRYLCDVDQESHFALGAIAESGDGAGESIGLGIARFIRLDDRADEIGAPVTAEAAIAVADAVHGRGLGRLMFLRLCSAAAERGIERFRCEVLSSNRAMHELVAGVAPDRTVTIDGDVMTIHFMIAATPPDATPSEAPTSSAYRFFRAAAEGIVEWTDAVRRLWRR